MWVLLWSGMEYGGERVVGFEVRGKVCKNFVPWVSGMIGWQVVILGLDSSNKYNI